MNFKFSLVEEHKLYQHGDASLCACKMNQQMAMQDAWDFLALLGDLEILIKNGEKCK